MCLIPFQVPVTLLTLTSDLVCNPILSISPTFSKVEITFLVCGCILGWQSVAYDFGSL